MPKTCIKTPLNISKHCICCNCYNRDVFRRRILSYQELDIRPFLVNLYLIKSIRVNTHSPVQSHIHPPLQTIIECLAVFLKWPQQLASVHSYLQYIILYFFLLIFFSISKQFSLHRWNYVATYAYLTNFVEHSRAQHD